MKYGIADPNYGKFASKENITKISIEAEGHGFDSLWASDHLIFPKGHKGFGNEFYDPVLTLSFIASITNTIKLGTSVIVLPYRNPVVFAKEISILDVLSVGRIIMGIGVGWLEEEFQALGINIDERRGMTDEYLEIINELYVSDSPEFKGKYFNFSDIDFYPKPHQKPCPPVWVGGCSRNALRRAVKYGSGWHAAGSTPEELKEKTEELNILLEEYNKSRNDFVVSVRKNLQITSRDISDERELPRGPVDKVIDGIDAYKDAGVSYIVFQILSSRFEGVIETMELFKGEIINCPDTLSL